MKDADGFIIKCKYTDWRIIDQFDNEDDVCTNHNSVSPGYTLRCYADEHCPYYEPDIKKAGDPNDNSGT